MKYLLLLLLLVWPGTDVYGFTINSTTPSRSLNTNFTPSTLYNVYACYTFSASVTATLSSNVTAGVDLRSDTVATPTTVRCQMSVGINLALGIAIAFANSQVSQCCYFVPKGHNVRLVVTSGSPTIVAQVEEQFIPEFDGTDFTTGFSFK